MVGHRLGVAVAVRKWECIMFKRTTTSTSCVAAQVSTESIRVLSKTASVRENVAVVEGETKERGRWMFPVAAGALQEVSSLYVYISGVLVSMILLCLGIMNTTSPLLFDRRSILGLI